MITPREKAIIVGAMFGGAKISQMLGGHTIDYSHFQDPLKTWISNNLYISNDSLEFYNRLYNKFKDGNFPEDYFEKMSPLALSIWYVATNKLQNVDMSLVPIIRDIFYKKWSINIGSNHGHGLVCETEEDDINLWLLLKQYILEIWPSMAPTHLLSVYPRKHKTIYLSGGQQFSKDGGVSWRAKVTPALYQHGYDVFNPAYEGAAVADQFGVNFDQLNLEEYIAAGGLFIEKDLEAIKASDAILTFLDESALRGAGTKSEATIAVDYNIPNYFVLDESIDPRKLPMWLAGCLRDTQYIFWKNDFETAVAEIVNLLG